MTYALVILAVTLAGFAISTIPSKYKIKEWMVILPVSILLLSFIIWLLAFSPYKLEEENTTISSQLIDIKYRDSQVDVGQERFSHLSSNDDTLKEAWYDSSNEYLIINLGGTNYHYCEAPDKIWSELKSSNSHYRYYTNNIRGDYDCRYNYMPTY